LPSGRVRCAGAGRRCVEDTDPDVVAALLGLVEPARRGDPMSRLCWTSLSTRHLAGELGRLGHRVSRGTVARLLKANGFSLQANAKTTEGTQHPDRDHQFSYLNTQIEDHQGAGDPVISVDAKKKELVGEYKNNGREWAPTGRPRRVNVHDFRGELGKANPYGIYDLAANTGFVAVGTDRDTPAFAVNTIRTWWNTTGRHDYASARRLLITADGGGSNGYRVRAWKSELAAFAAETGLSVTVCHLPPGTSKWNKIEHRLFAHISMNWRGRPLTSHDVIVNTIAATTTSTGLRVRAVLDEALYPTGVKIPDKQMRLLADTGLWQRHEWHGEWNYTLAPLPLTKDDA
jgi:Rhodopirellula transposase DDE domain